MKIFKLFKFRNVGKILTKGQTKNISDQTKLSNFHNENAKLLCAEFFFCRFKQQLAVILCCMLFAIALFVQWNVAHIWEIKPHTRTS